MGKHIFGDLRVRVNGEESICNKHQLVLFSISVESIEHFSKLAMTIGDTIFDMKP